MKSQKTSNLQGRFIRLQDLFKETEIRDSIDISLHLTKDEIQDGDMSRQKGGCSRHFALLMCVRIF